MTDPFGGRLHYLPMDRIRLAVQRISADHGLTSLNNNTTIKPSESLHTPTATHTPTIELEDDDDTLDMLFRESPARASPAADDVVTDLVSQDSTPRTLPRSPVVSPLPSPFPTVFPPIAALLPPPMSSSVSNLVSRPSLPSSVSVQRPLLCLNV